MAIDKNSLLSDFVMLKNSLKHDRVVFSHFLDKEMEITASLDKGKVQFEFEDAPNELRICTLVIYSNYIILPLGIAYLLYNTLCVSIILTIVLFILVCLKLIVPIVVKKKMTYFDQKNREYQGNRYSQEMDTMTNSSFLKSYGIEKKMLERLARLYVDFHSEHESKYLLYQSMLQHFGCTFNPLVAFIREQVSFLLYKYDSIVEYIKLNLQRGRYVELYFDEYYVPQMHTYKKEHHLHGDLAYGFDDTHIYFLGLYLGKPFEFKLTYDEVIDGTNSSLEFDANVMLTVYHFNPENYQFSITALYKSLRDYLEGVIDNIEFYNFDSPDHVYDIHALTKLSNDTGLELFLNDIRIPYLIKEHTQLMMDRIYYLKNSELFCTLDSADIFDMIDKLLMQTSAVLSLVIKYSMTDTKSLPEKISVQIKSIIKSQKECYSKILNLLFPHVDRSRIKFFIKCN